jgi:diguanylate cyclase (GGDEF)-like protein
MTDIDDVGDIFDFVSKTLMDAMNITHSNSYLVNQRGQIVSYASWERSAQNVVKAESLTNELVAESAAQWCYENGEPVHIPRNHEDKRESSRIHAIRREKGIGSSLCWPVIVSGQTIGVITINRERSQRDFNENEINLFTSVVNQLSSALHGHNLSKALQHQVNHDSLTQLPNRRFFESELNKQLDNQVQAGTLGAIMFLDLDGFKSVNDSIGHSSGDKLLKHVAMRLQNRIPENDILARIGGDEFAVICKDLSNQQDAIIIAERLAASLCMPFQIGKESVNIGTSIGLSFFPLDGLSANELLHNADQAMYKAKSQGKNCVVRYEHSMGKELRERSQLEVEIRHAIDNDELQLHFQPQVNVDEGIVTGVEALIRWQHPSGKLLAPGQFIPIAEKSDAIDHIGAWVLNRAIWQLHQWQDTSLNKLRMGVNIAATQFIHKGFADDVLTLLSQSQISPGMLELEVTESVVMRDLQAVAERLNTLRAAGVRIAVDDFGTGYSSLSYLQDLPLDVLKIDRAFVSRLENEEADRSIVNTIILLANGLKLSTIAEGVETQKQLEQISRLGCSIIQGYYFAKPCTAQELPQVIDGIERSLETPLMRKMAR